MEAAGELSPDRSPQLRKVSILASPSAKQSKGFWTKKKPKEQQQLQLSFSKLEAEEEDKIDGDDKTPEPGTSGDSAYVPLKRASVSELQYGELLEHVQVSTTLTISLKLKPRQMQIARVHHQDLKWMHSQARDQR